MNEEVESKTKTRLLSYSMDWYPSEPNKGNQVLYYAAICQYSSHTTLATACFQLDVDLECRGGKERYNRDFKLVHRLVFV